MKFGKMKGFVAATLVAMASLAAQGGRAEAETLRFLTWKAQAAGDAQAITIQWLADEFNRRSGGKDKIEVMWGGSAASIREMPEAIAGGIGIMGDIALPYYMDKFILNNAAGYFLPQPKSPVELAEMMMRWTATYPQFDAEFAKYNLKAISWRPLEDYGMLCREPVRSIADLKGKRIRSYGTAYPALIEALGATPVSVTTTEAYEALERGILDCTPTGLSYAHGFKYDEVAKYYSAIPLGSSYGQAIVVNLSMFNKLSDDSKALLLNLGEQYPIHYATVLNQIADKVRADWDEKGVEYIPFPPNALADVVNDPKIKEIRETWIKKASEMGLPAEKLAAELEY